MVEGLLIDFTYYRGDSIIGGVKHVCTCREHDFDVVCCFSELRCMKGRAYTGGP